MTIPGRCFRMNTNAYSINPNTYSIRVSPALAKEAAPLFEEMGTDMSEAVNSFLRQTILRLAYRRPFRVDIQSTDVRGHALRLYR